MCIVRTDQNNFSNLVRPSGYAAGYFNSVQRLFLKPFVDELVWLLYDEYDYSGKPEGAPD